MLFYPV
jgi:hypothetical protein